MTRARRILAATVAAGLALTPGLSQAAGSGGSHRIAAPRPVAVYVGGQVVASGQSVRGAIFIVRRQIPFAIRTPSYIPAGYVPVQLAVTPKQRAVSDGFSTLSYALVARNARGAGAHGNSSVQAIASASGFHIDQAAGALPVVGATHVTTETIGSGATRLHATLQEFKAAGHDILILTGTDSAGHGYDVVTDAAISHLTPFTLTRIAASLH